MDVEYDVPEELRVVEKRFKYKSYNEGLKDVHLPSALSDQSKLDQELEDTQSHFYESLNHLQQLNLSPSFIKFAKQAGPLSASLPLLLYNWKEVVELWLSAQAASDDEGFKAILELLQKLAQDLRTILSPVYPELLDRLLQLTSRSLSTESLTTLLSTLSALFKYLLIPTSDTKILEQTWLSIRESIPKCLPEVQRAVAEVWGSVLRRMKASMRGEAVIFIARDLERIEDAAAWCFVSACKSVSQSLHTVTITLVNPLLEYYTTCENSDDTFMLLRRMFTAFIHHVKGPEQFSSVVDLIVKELQNNINSTEVRLRRVLEVATLVTSVRNGSRITKNHLLDMYKFMLALPLDIAPRSALLKFSSSLLMAGDMAIWMSHGRHCLSRLWDVGAEAMMPLNLQLHGVLAELGWGGWKMIALPGLLKRTGKLLEYESQETIRLLASLCRESKLGDLDLICKKKVNDWVIDWLKRAVDGTEKMSEAEAMQLNDILALSPHFGPEATEALVQLTDKYLKLEEEGDDFPRPAWIVGTCMICLSTRPSAQWSRHVDLSFWTRLCIKQWSWSKNVIGGLVAISDVESKSVLTVTFTEAYTALRESILSHSRALRLNSLKLLSSLVDIPDDTAEVIKRCLLGEEVSLDVQGVRERTVRIGRVPQIIKTDDDRGAELCARWLIAQLKVNLRPLWSPAASAISTVSQRFGDLIWDMLFRELKLITSENLEMTVDHPNDEDPESSSSDDPWEEERSWRDPSAHKLRIAVMHWTDDRYHILQTKRASYSGSTERFDRNSYEQQLLATLGECASLAEKHNRDLVPFFLGMVGPNADTKMPRAKLNSWLTLFAKFNNPKALHSTETLRALYTGLLSHPDRTLQSSALSCVFTYKQRSLSLYEDKLRLLLDETRWRDELTLLNISAVEPQDRGEVVEVVIRLLFGIMLERKGRSRGADRRSAVLTAIAGCSDDELALLVDLMLQPLTQGRSSADRAEQGYVIQKLSDDVTDKQMTGYLTLLGDVLKNLGSRLLRYWPALLGVTVDIIVNAQERITVDKGVAEGDDPETEEDVEDVGPTSSSRAARSIRQLGLKRLADFFKCPVSFDFGPWVKEAFPAFISPRLPMLDKENTQAPSALLELFFVWTFDANHAQFLVRYDERVLPKVYDCLVATNVKPAVILRIFDIVDKLLVLSVDDPSIVAEVIKPHISLLLSNLVILLDRSKSVAAISTPLGQRQIGTLSAIAHFSSSPTEATMLLQMFIPFLRKQTKVIPEKTKVDLLKIVGHLVHLIPEMADGSSEIYQKFYGVLSSLFQSLRSRQARLSVVAAFHDLAKTQISLQDLAELLDSLNSYSSKRIDEPDFNRRLEAFTRLNDSLYKSLSASDWLPIIYDMLSFIQDPNELAIRNSSSLAMKNFIDLVAARVSVEHEQIFSRVLFPGLKNGLRSRNDLVRVEILGVIAHAVIKCEHIETLQDMRILLANGDEEANFFNNIHHVQIHRRSRALRRLADLCDSQPMRNSTLNDILIPLISNYVVSTSSLDHHLVNDAINTTGRLAKHLAWNAYYVLIQKYLRLSKAKDESERVYVRTLVAILENFHFQMEEDVIQDSHDENAELDEEEQEAGPVQITTSQTQSTAKIVDAVNSRLLPSLLAYLESRDATTEDTTRIPVAIGIVKVARHLPQASAQLQVTKLLTTTSQILRSKSQETRDLTRDTLSRIAVILGPDFLPLIIKELRAALTRGPHLHVLASTVHHLLAHITTGDHADKFTTLDECVPDIAHISAEVIFGESGKDVQTEGFKTKMREVKSSSSKGLDSFSITAKFITPPRISGLLAPLRSIMQETESIKVMQLVDDVLRQISNGLNSNAHLVPTDLLSLCHTLISQNSRFLQQAAPRRKNLVKGDAIVQTKRQVAASTDHFSNNSFRFVVFGLDLLHTALRRNRFDFHDKDVMSRLESMVVAVGNALYSTSSPVLISGLKVVSGLVKCPLQSLDKSLPVFIRQNLDILKQVGTTESDVAQASLKCLATIFRDGPSVTVKEKDLAYLLELVSPDLEEPSRQNTVFMMLRAIVSRKFVVPEIYDLMDKVAEIMVTNQSPQVQELSRGVLLQFLLDYPQGKGRLKNQMTFLAKNLSYVHDSGRKSVMELLGAIITKFQLGLVNEYAELLFVALVMVIANDDSAKCREMAAELIKSLIERLGEEKRNTFLGHLHKWAGQLEQERLVRVSVQVYGIVIEALKEEVETSLGMIVKDMNEILRFGSERLKAVGEKEEDENAMDVDVELDWQASYYSLIVVSKLVKIFPGLIKESETKEEEIDWRLVVDHLLFPHAWVRTASCRLLGTLFGAVDVRAPIPDVEEEEFSPFTKSGMKEIAGKLCAQLKSEHLDEALSMQIVKCLFFIGKCFALVPFPENKDSATAEQGDEDEEAEGEEQQSDRSGNDLPWLFSKLSYQIRSALIAKRNRSASRTNWYHQPLSIIRWFAAMASHLEANVLERFLVHVLSPVYRIIEDDTIHDPKMDELKSLSTELQDLVQSKVGTTKFSLVYTQIRQGVTKVRRNRKEARVLQVAMDPQAAASRKMSRNSVKKESRKRKGREFA
ncbi:U3 snoRNP protein [Stygiomarasmius scandens]|uniref:U3 snoRNP protein n=1 Tax=Marasmiellus scandens TaxID=2682957 RepID=A0ABR1K4F8_9AGAR